MQIFPCPFCGPRDEREFHFAGELGKIRPETTGQVPAQDWAAYLHTQRNEKGAVHEVWIHTPCAEMFVLERDSVSMDVTGARALRGEAAP
ncbi:MAG: sarcosine oxidase subunit delta [Pseudomonadota bacterium]